MVFRNDIIKFCFGDHGNIYISWSLLISLLKLFLTEFIMMWARIMLFTLIYYIFCQIFTFNLRELIIFFPTLLRLHKTKCQKTMLPFPSGKLLKRTILYFFRCNLDPLKWRVFTVQTCSLKYKLADLQSSFRVWVSWYVFLGSGLFLLTSPKCFALNRTECSNEVLEDSLENIGDAVPFILRWVPLIKCFMWSCFS